MTYEIKKGVPIPPKNVRMRRGLSHVLRQMAIGDCIEGVRQGGSVHQMALGVGIQITTRKQADGTYTVWRVA